jgi:hypothetical protein
MEAGYRGMARPGQWMPVTITVRNPGGDFRGTLSILSGVLPADPQRQGFGGAGMAMPAKGMYGGTVAPAIYRVPVVLPAGSTKRFTTYVLAAADVAHVDLLNSQDQAVAGTETRVRLGYNEGLAAVVSDNEQALDLLGSVRLPGAGGQVQVVHFKPADLPNSAIVLRAFDTVALDDAATEAFTPSQKNALLDYVDMGGGLLIAGGASWRKTIAGVPAELLPVAISGTRSLADLPRTRTALGAGRLTTPVDAAVGERRAGATVLGEEGVPILVEAPFGQGYVMFSAVEFTLEPMASWNGTRTLLRQALVRLIVRQPAGFGGGPMQFRVSRPGISDRGSAMSQALMNIPALDLPSLRLVGLLLLGYVLLAGPLNYLLLWRLGRRDLAWITLPLIALVFAAGAYSVGLRAKGKDILANEVRIIHLSDRSSRAYVETFTGLFVPHRGTYSARPGGQPFVSGLGGFYGGGPQGPVGAGIVLVTGGGASSPADVRLVDVNAWSMRGFSSEELVTTPGTLTQDLHLANGRITGTVTNRLPYALTDGFVVAGDSYQTFSRIGKGETVQVNLAVSSSPSPQLGQPIAYRIYQMPTYKGDPGQAAQRETLRRVQIVGALFPYNGMNSGTDPMFVGWASSSHLPLKVNGQDADVRDLDAIVMPLRVAQAAITGPLAEGAVTARLVDLTGEQINATGSGLYFGTKGAATYELALPGAAWHNVQLRLSRNLGPYGAKLGMGSMGGQPQINQVDVTVYNYRTGAWDAMALRSEGDVDVALVSTPAAHISPEGLLQVRLQTKAVAANSLIGPLSVVADPGAQ